MNVQSEIERAFKIVGERPVRPDGVDKVTGKARYGADATAPGMLWGAVLRSPHPHARIKQIDASKAEALTGVLTGAGETVTRIGHVAGPGGVRYSGTLM